MKNTMVEIRLNIDVWIIPTLYIVPLDCTFTIPVGSILKISAECIYMYQFPKITKLHQSDHQIYIIVKFTLKKHVPDVYNISYVEHM